MIAELILYRKQKTHNGDIMQMVIWKIAPSAERPHGLKYRLHYGSIEGACYVRYDNKLSKGDHKHIGDREEQYQFESTEKLIADFESDMSAHNKGQIT